MAHSLKDSITGREYDKFVSTADGTALRVATTPAGGVSSDLVEASGNKQNSKEGNAIIDNAIEVFDELIAKVNQKSVENRPAHLKSVKAELETKAGSLIEQLNKLG